MATHHRGTGQPLDRDTTLHGKDTDILNDYHYEFMDNFENVEQENHTNLATPKVINSASSISTARTP